MLVTTSATLGWFIPAFYQWSGSDQSRMSPWVGIGGIVLIVVSCAAASLLPFLPLRSERLPDISAVARQFSLRNLMLITGLIALIVAGLMRFPVITGIALCGLAYLHCAIVAVCHSALRWSLGGLMACMVLPFLWLLGYQELHSLGLGVLGALLSMPMLLPAGFITAWSGANMHDWNWLPMVLTAAELELGLWLIAGGIRRSLAYLILVMLTSVFSSFALHALILA